MSENSSCRLLVGVVASVILLAGCAGAAADGDAPIKPSTDGSASLADPSPTGSADDGVRTNEFESPLADYVGFAIPGLAELGDVEWIEMQRRTEEAIGDCMRAEGFEYIPWVDDPATTYVPVDEDIDYESRRFAEIYGFGVSTQFYAQRDVGPDLVGHSGDGSGVVWTENPNTAIAENLSGEEKRAYMVTLWGSDHPLLNPDAHIGQDGQFELDPDWQPSGCRADAQTIALGTDTAFFREFGQDLAKLAASVDTDQTYIDYVDQVDLCVADHGYDWFSFREMHLTYEAFDKRVFEVDATVGGDPFEELPQEELALMSAQELDALYDTPRDLTDEARARLGEIQADEKIMAVIVWDCGGSASEVRRVRTEILHDMEKHFLAMNRERLQPFKGDSTSR